MMRLTLSVASVLLCGASLGQSQNPENLLSVAHLEGLCQAGAREVVDSVVVRAEGASWIRLYFGSSRLPGDPGMGGACTIRLVSLLDGAEQTLNAEHLAQWGNSSAYFNGDSVRVELLSQGAAGQASVDIMSASTGQPTPPDGYGERSICGPVDDRVLSSDPAIARAFPTICSAWLINDANRTMLSAGHCGVAPGTVMEFNVPLSNPDGSVVHPPPRDQYAVEPTSIQYRFNGMGLDWAYFGCYPNTQTGLTPAQAQGAFFELATAIPVAAGQPVGVTGFGSVSAPVSFTWSYAQKAHVGAFQGLAGNIVQHTADTTGGNSGSPVFLAADRRAIAIHTNAGCSSTGGYNSATALSNPDLQNALANPRGVCASGVGSVAGAIAAVGDLNNHVGVVDDQSGRFGAVGQTPPGMQGLATDGIRRRLIAVDSGCALWAIDTAGGSSTLLGALEPDPGLISGLAFDPVQDVAYGVRASDGQLLRIDLATRQTTPRGQAFGGNIGGLEADPRDGVLYALDDAPEGTRLLRFDVGSDQWMVVGYLGAGATDCNALACTSDGRLFTINAPTGTLLRIDPGTGAATVVGATGALFGSAFGMAGAVPSDPCEIVDFNDDGAINGFDLEALEQIINGSQDRPEADVNQDGALNGFDLETYEQRINGNCW